MYTSWLHLSRLKHLKVNYVFDFMHFQTLLLLIIITLLLLLLILLFFILKYHPLSRM